MTLLTVQTTSDDRAVLEKIAHQLVALRLAACVQIGGPITSTYRWKDSVEVSTEWLCAIKTTDERYAEVEREIFRAHNYEQPEIIALAIHRGSEGYLRWLVEQVG